MKAALTILLALLPQSTDGVRDTLRGLVTTSAISGHEQRIAASIADRLKQRGLAPTIDAMSNVTVTVGSGNPHRLIVANIDEPGYIVSGITADGYLRMQRVGTARPHVYFDQYFEGQRLSIFTASGKTVTGVSAIPSTHLARGLIRTERPFELTDAYVDVGVRSAPEVRELGIRILDPISIEKTFSGLAHDRVSGPFLSDRAGAAVLMEILTTTPASEIKGTVTGAFTVQEHFGRKGIDRMSVAFNPDEVYILEPLNEDQPPGQTTSNSGRVLANVRVDVQNAPRIRRVLARFEGVVREAALGPRPNSPAWKSGTEVVRIGIPLMFYATPVEVLDLKNLQSTIRFLRSIIQSGVS